VTEATYYRWRKQFGGLKAEDAKKLKQLELQNSRRLCWRSWLRGTSMPDE
jgi:hypothetical protein